MTKASNMPLINFFYNALFINAL